MFKFLKLVRELNDKYKKLAVDTGEGFNIFSILDIETDEVKHSRFLAFLLNPKKSHGQGDIFLNLFLKRISKVLGENGGTCIFERNELSNFRVQPEVVIDGGRIDILLIKDDACIVIENKIDAEDQHRQLERYYEYARSRNIQDDRIILIYLTKFGTNPTDVSLGQLDLEKVLCISYEKHITTWLKECMRNKKIQRVPHMRETLFQYCELLKKLTGQLTMRGKLTMKIADKFKENENYSLIPHLEQGILEFRVQIQFKFWEVLTKSMEDNGFSKYDDQSSIEASIENIRDSCDPNRQRTNSLGLTFEIPHQPDRLLEEHEIAIRIEIENGWIFCGIVLFKNNQRVGNCVDEHFNNLDEIIGDNSSLKAGNRWWLGWKYPNIDIRLPTSNSGDEQIGDLLDCENRDDLVDALVKELLEISSNLNSSAREHSS